MATIVGLCAEECIMTFGKKQDVMLNKKNPYRPARQDATRWVLTGPCGPLRFELVDHRLVSRRTVLAPRPTHWGVEVVEVAARFVEAARFHWARVRYSLLLGQDAEINACGEEHRLAELAGQARQDHDEREVVGPNDERALPVIFEISARLEAAVEGRTVTTFQIVVSHAWTLFENAEIVLVLQRIEALGVLREVRVSLVRQHMARRDDHRIT